MWPAENKSQLILSIYRGASETESKFHDMAKMTLGSPCYQLYKTDIGELHALMLNYLLSSKMIHTEENIVYIHSTESREHALTDHNTWKIPDFTGKVLEKKTMDMPSNLKIPEYIMMMLSLLLLY